MIKSEICPVEPILLVLSSVIIVSIILADEGIEVRTIHTLIHCYWQLFQSSQCSLYRCIQRFARYQ